MDDEEGRRRGVEEPDGVCDCEAEWTWRDREAWVREGGDTVGEMGDVRDVVGCGATTAAEGGRSLSPAWVEAQQPCQRIYQCCCSRAQGEQKRMGCSCTGDTYHGSCWKSSM